MQTAECVGKVVSKHQVCVSLKQLTAASSNPAPLAGPNPFPFTPLFCWPPEPCSLNFGKKRSLVPTAISGTHHMSSRERGSCATLSPTSTEVPAKEETWIFKMICTYSRSSGQGLRLRLFMQMWASGFC